MLREDVDVLLFVEHVSRELEAAILLKRRLSTLKLKAVIVPVHYLRYFNLLRYRFRTAIVPFLYSEHNQQFTRLITSHYVKPPVVINLHQEQIGGRESLAFMLPSDSLSRNIVHMAWGNGFAEQLKAAGCPPATIFQPGSIRAEIGYRLASRQPRAYRKRPHILVTLNFGFAFFSPQYLTNIERSGRPDAREEQESARAALAWFTGELLRVIDAMPGADFEIRPHPGDAPHAYRELRAGVKPYSNVVFSREGSVYQRLTAADAVLTWTSTTALEAELMNVPSVCLIDKQNETHMEFVHYWNHFDTAEAIVAWLKHGCPRRLSMGHYVQAVYGDYPNASANTASIVAERTAGMGYARLRFGSGWLYLISRVALVDIPKAVLHRVGLLKMVRGFYRRIAADDLKDRESVRRTEDQIAILLQE